jgi:hypothetical protein
MRMPHRKARAWRTVKGDLNLWKLLSFKDNILRVCPYGGLRMMFFKGDFPDGQVLRMPKEKETLGTLGASHSPNG